MNRLLFSDLSKRRLSVTKLSSENKLATFRLNALVIIRAKGLGLDDWSIQSKPELKLVTDNLFTQLLLVENHWVRTFSGHICPVFTNEMD